ncbi:MAG TPA: pyridoxal phosphate-dependent aminotransferase [Thermodesulfobacteriota bacterium]|nr:pyridoxal phosphate-dependent aminotransferase [Thermodesulfobacteriota bacterium]
MPSKLSEEISPFYVMEVLERAKEIEASGGSVVHFEVGMPDFSTAGVICEAAVEAIKEGDTRYTHSLGILELREAIAEDYNTTYGVNVSPGQVVVTLGSSPALFLSMLALLDPGDEVIITDPHYACYPQLIKIAGGVPVPVRVYEEEGFQIDSGRLRKAVTSRTKAILINSPANPTGTLLTSGSMSEIAALGVPVISDEIYHGLSYGEESRTILEFADDAVAVNGFSKLYSMPGWRLGYLIAPAEMIRPIQKLQQNLFISPNPFVQRAGVTAIKEGKKEALGMVGEFDRRRRALIEGLKELGFTLKVEPRGAFYVFVNVSDISRDSHSLAFDILEKAHVAVTPGIDFGQGGEGYMRFSYAASIADIEEGMRRLGQYLNARKSGTQ